MNTYEGLFIFGESVPDERVKELSAYVTGEIEKAGGKILQTRDMGRRSFARTMQKTESGVYLAVVFQSAGEKIAVLNARYKLNDEIFRFQLTRLEEKFVNRVPATAPAERSERGDRDRGDRDRGERGDRDRDRGERGDRGPRDRSYASA